MTVVVWDGRTLATDLAATDGRAMWSTQKAWMCAVGDREVILSGAGPLQTILAMREWYKAGADHNTFPREQLSSQWCHFLVVTNHGLLRYENGVVPIEHGRKKCAFGEGKDFAYGALAMGADAQRAVEVANERSPHCGLGVATYQL